MSTDKTFLPFNERTLHNPEILRRLRLLEDDKLAFFVILNAVKNLGFVIAVRDADPVSYVVTLIHSEPVEGSSPPFIPCPRRVESDQGS